MIVVREWSRKSKHRVHHYYGLFLFGIVPLFIRRYGCYV